MKSDELREKLYRLRNEMEEVQSELSKLVEEDIELATIQLKSFIGKKYRNDRGGFEDVMGWDVGTEALSVTRYNPPDDNDCWVGKNIVQYFTDDPFNFESYKEIDDDEFKSLRDKYLIGMV